MTKSTRHFIRHYAEMVAAMFLGMGVLFRARHGRPWCGRRELGRGEKRRARPAPARHGPEHDRADGRLDALPRTRLGRWNEMAASMLIPTAGVIALLGTGLVDDIGALLMVEHVVMLPSMLVAMLLRREEYCTAPTLPRVRSS